MYEDNVHRTNTSGRGPRGVRRRAASGKRYGDLWALRDVDLARRRRARVLGLLGHNGAGKTTADPHPHHARAAHRRARRSVAGLDVVAERRAVRARIGARRPAGHRRRAAQRPREPRAGRPPLPPADARAARRRADELLEQLDLADAADRLVQDLLRRHAPPARPRRQPRRRAARCCSSTSRPPASTRAAATTCGSCCASSSRDGTTLVLTTQYLEEADRLADDIVVLDHGARRRRRHARASSRRASAATASTSRVAARRRARPAAAALARASPTATATFDARRRRASPCPCAPGTRLIEVVRALDAAGVDAIDVHRREATLDDVFLTLTDARRARRSPPHEHRRPAHRRQPRRARWLVSDSLALARRNLEHVRQIPEKLLDVTLQPLMFVLLFAYVFGGVDPRAGRQLPRVPHRRHPRPDAGVRDHGPGDVDRDRPQRGHRRPLPLAADRRARPTCSATSSPSWPRSMLAHRRAARRAG